MRSVLFLAMAGLALVASGCTIHIVEGPAGAAQAQQWPAPQPVLVAQGSPAPTPVAAAPTAATPAPTPTPPAASPSPVSASHDDHPQRVVYHRVPERLKPAPAHNSIDSSLGSRPVAATPVMQAPRTSSRPTPVRIITPPRVADERPVTPSQQTEAERLRALREVLRNNGPQTRGASTRVAKSQ